MQKDPQQGSFAKEPYCGLFCKLQIGETKYRLLLEWLDPFAKRPLLWALSQKSPHWGSVSLSEQEKKRQGFGSLSLTIDHMSRGYD